jgi:hypothetical protein
MFQNNAGFQKGIQLIVTPKDGKFLPCLEIRTETNPNDSKQYQLTDKELVKLRDLLTTFIDSEKESWTSKLDIQEAHVVE